MFQELAFFIWFSEQLRGKVFKINSERVVCIFAEGLSVDLLSP